MGYTSEPDTPWWVKGVCWTVVSRTLRGRNDTRRPDLPLDLHRTASRARRERSRGDDTKARERERERERERKRDKRRRKAHKERRRIRKRIATLGMNSLLLPLLPPSTILHLFKARKPSSSFFFFSGGRKGIF
jgi:hypothetical protein